MKTISTIFTILIFVGLPMSNTQAEDVINEIVSETVPITGIHYDPAPLPDFPGGLFRFTATFKNSETSEEQIASLAFRVRELTEKNRLFNGDNGRNGKLTSKLTAGDVFEWKTVTDNIPFGDDVKSASALIQSNLPSGGRGNFEVVYRDSNDQLHHWFRRNDVDGFPWEAGNDGKPFGEDAKSAPALIQSNPPSGGRGNFEVVYRDSNDQLHHWFRRNDVDGFPWEAGNDGKPFGEDAKSAPALIQSNLPPGGRGNFEVVYRDSNDQLRHWFRRNDVDGFPWEAGNDGKPFGNDVKSTPALIQNRTNGNLEVVYRDSNNQLRHWFRDANFVWRPGNNGVPFAENVISEPALIQSNLGSQGDNFEVVVRKSDNKLHHYFRRRNPDNKDIFEWRSGGTPFAENAMSAPTLIQSNLGTAGGNFEVVVEKDGVLRHYLRTKKGGVILKPGEEVSTQFVIGLVGKEPKQFQFYVDAEGFRVPKFSKVVYLRDGDNFNMEINGNTEKDVMFIVKSGMHRNQSITPREGDVYIGEDGAVMNGSWLLTKWNKDKTTTCDGGGNYPWSHDYDPEMDGLIHPDEGDHFCLEGKTCLIREDLYINNMFMKQVASDAKLAVGEWKFDDPRDEQPEKLYACFKEDMANNFNIKEHKIEISRLRVALGGIDTNKEDLETRKSKSNVTIKNLVIDKYATPVQFGAIGYQKPGDNWVIENNDVRYSHAAGIAFGHNAVVKGNYVHDNGQIGIKSGLIVKDETEDSPEDRPLRRSEVVENVIGSNGKPDLGYNLTWEGGGTKFSFTKNLEVGKNWVYQNKGPGLWTDISNCGTSYYCNTVERNRDEGLFHEISYRAYILNNLFRFNGQGTVRPQDYDAAQVQISTSRGVTARSNTIITDSNNGNGIVIVDDSNRTQENTPEVQINYCEGRYPMGFLAWRAMDNTIESNDITHAVGKGRNGEVQREKVNDEFILVPDTSDLHNLFNNNDYHVADDSVKYWFWKNERQTFAEFQQLGQEIDSENPDTVFSDQPPHLDCGDPRRETDLHLICLVAPGFEHYLEGSGSGGVVATGDSCDSVDGFNVITDPNRGDLVSGDRVFIAGPNFLGGWTEDSDQTIRVGASLDEASLFEIHKIAGDGGAGSGIEAYDRIAFKAPSGNWVSLVDGALKTVEKDEGPGVNETFGVSTRSFLGF